MQGAAAIAQADHGGAGALFSGDIGGGGVALVAEDAFDGRPHGLGGDAEFARAGGDQFVGRIGLGVGVGGDRIVRLGRLARAGGAGAQRRHGGGGETGLDQLAAVHGGVPNLEGSSPRACDQHRRVLRQPWGDEVNERLPFGIAIVGRWNCP